MHFFLCKVVQNHWPDGVKKAHRWSPTVNLWIFFGPWDVAETLVNAWIQYHLGFFPRHQEGSLHFSRRKTWIPTLTFIKKPQAIWHPAGGFWGTRIPKIFQSYQSLTTRMDIFIELISPIQPTVPDEKNKNYFPSYCFCQRDSELWDIINPITNYV